ncbi:MAG TPA: nuclear transport factor 2 family protein [Acidimicrobiales bacterium]|nr:nuclear transport factor 2 family protein [Acidimicrobiales bacterium]
MSASPAADPTGEAVRAVTNLVARYAELIDGGDFAGLGQLFAEAVFGGEGDAVVRGGQAVEGIFRSMVMVHDDGTPRTKHVTTNLQVEVDEGGEVATARSYVTVFQALPDLPLQPIVAGRYRDRFARREGRWVFVERRFVTDLVGDVHRHLRGGAAALGG